MLDDDDRALAPAEVRRLCAARHPRGPERFVAEALVYGHFRAKGWIARRGAEYP